MSKVFFKNFKKAFRIKFIVLFIVIIFLIALFLLWLVPFVHNEVLTAQHKDEFIGLQNDMLTDIKSIKVLEYDDRNAKVYYITPYSGDVVTFRHHEEGWVEISWETIWAKGGNASDFIWPYWYDFLRTF